MSQSLKGWLAEVWRFLLHEGVLRQGVVTFALWFSWKAFEWGSQYADVIMANPTGEHAAVIAAVTLPVGWVVQQVIGLWVKTQHSTPSATEIVGPQRPDWSR